MPAAAVPALGTILAYSANGTTYATIGQVTTVSKAGGGEVGERDTTVLASLSKTTRPTIPDYGELTFEINFDGADTGHAELEGLIDTPTSSDGYWKVTTANGEIRTMRGWLKTFDGANAGGIDENLTASLTVRVNSVARS